MKILSDRMLRIKGSAEHSRWTCVDRPSCSVDEKLHNNAPHRKCLRKRRLPAFVDHDLATVKIRKASVFLAAKVRTRNDKTLAVIADGKRNVNLKSGSYERVGAVSMRNLTKSYSEFSSYQPMSPSKRFNAIFSDGVGAWKG